MKYNSVIIIKIPGGRDMEYETGKDDNIGRIMASAQQSVATRTAEIVHRGEFELEEHRNLFNNTRGLATYVLFPFMNRVDLQDDDAVWNELQGFMNYANYPTLFDKTYTNQIIRMEFVDASLF